MPINQTEGRSVYIQKDISERENTGLHGAAREWVRRVHRSGVVLDLGCSDFVTSRKLQESGIPVVGVDLDLSALRQAHVNAEGSQAILADVRRLPFDVVNCPITTVIALDVIEHFKRDEALELLQNLRRLPRIQNLIVSMPIISPLSAATVIEAGRAVKHGKMPETGLFDRTHRIFTNRAGHKKLFREAGFVVAQEETTNWFESITGEWEGDVSQTTPGFRRPHARAFHKLAWEIIPKLVHPLDSSRRRAVTDSLIQYQGVYLLSV